MAFIKRTKLRFDINNLKFKDILLYKLSKLLSKFYKKKVEFNIINLNSFEYNPSIFTDILRRKLSYRKAHILNLTKFFLKKMEDLEKIKNLDLNKGFINVDYDTIENRDRNININTLVKDVNLNEIIKNLYNTKNHNNIKIIFNSIEFKNLGGIKL
ncbi:hypothetical protein, partial [Spirosoma jeollabukense]